MLPSRSCVQCRVGSICYLPVCSTYFSCYRHFRTQWHNLRCTTGGCVTSETSSQCCIVGYKWLYMIESSDAVCLCVWPYDSVRPVMHTLALECLVSVWAASKYKGPHESLSNDLAVV